MPSSKDNKTHTGEGKNRDRLKNNKDGKPKDKPSGSKKVEAAAHLTDEQLAEIGSKIFAAWGQTEDQFFEQLVRPWEDSMELPHQEYEVRVVPEPPFAIRLCIIMDIVPIGADVPAMFTNPIFGKHFRPFIKPDDLFHPLFLSRRRWEQYGARDRFMDDWVEVDHRETLETYQKTGKLQWPGK